MREVRVGLRARLTLIYGSLFLATGGLLVGVTYVLTARVVNARFRVLITQAPAGGSGPLPELPDPVAARKDVMWQVGQQRQAILGQLLQISVLTMITLGILAVVVGYIVAGRTLRPLQQVTATARRLSESTLHERIGLTGPHDEIKELADTFDGMLDRLHRAFHSQKRFIANASHELRTPLAINRAVLDVAIAKPAAPPETRELARRLLDNTARQERLIESLLLLARSEREQGDRAGTDLAAPAAGAIEQLSAAAAEAGVTIEPALHAAVTAGDPVLLERCVFNLVENAIKYNVAGGHVGVRTGTGGRWAYVQVENTGPAVPPDHLPAIFEPFRRLRADRVGSARGAGLGLSIVRAVTNAHHGDVHAYARPAGGLLITLRFPRVPVPSRSPADEPHAALTSRG